MANEGIDASVGTTVNSYDDALTETIIGLFKTEVSIISVHGKAWIPSSAPRWNGLIGSEITSLLESNGNVPPAEREMAYYRQMEESDEAA